MISAAVILISDFFPESVISDFSRFFLLGTVIWIVHSTYSTLRAVLAVQESWLSYAPGALRAASFATPRPRGVPSALQYQTLGVLTPAHTHHFPAAAMWGFYPCFYRPGRPGPGPSPGVSECLVGQVINPWYGRIMPAGSTPAARAGFLSLGGTPLYTPATRIRLLIRFSPDFFPRSKI